MSIEINDFKINEADDMLQDIRSQIEKISKWCLNNAADAMGKLHDQWNDLLNTVDTTDSNSFMSQSNNIMRDCEAFKDQIDRQIVIFTDCFENRQDTIRQLAGQNTDTNKSMADLLEIWNETLLPQLNFLYEKIEELEIDITATNQNKEDTGRINDE